MHFLPLRHILVMNQRIAWIAGGFYPGAHHQYHLDIKMDRPPLFEQLELRGGTDFSKQMTF